MISLNIPSLIASSVEAVQQGAEKATVELSRLKQYDDERFVIATLVGVGVLLALYAWWVYRKDSAELRPGVGAILLLLRLTAFAGLFIFFLAPEKRTDHRIVRNSRVLVLADVSQSMGLTDSDSSSQTGLPRNQQVAELFSQGGLLASLQKKHDVVVSRFAESSQQITVLPKKKKEPAEEADANQENENTDKSSDDQENPSQAKPTAKPIDWVQELTPSGNETRIGEAIRDAIQSSRGEPLAGIILLTDGEHNAGIEVASALEMAAEAKVPIYTIGVGSAEIRKNIRVSDFLAPPRAYPGDAMTLTAYLQATGYGGRLVTVELRRKLVDGADSNFETIETERIPLEKDGKITSVPFEITEEEPGKSTYEVRVLPLEGESNTTDNQQLADVEVVDRELRVLLMASGPTREYRFLRNQLQRDKSITVDVLLQSFPKGISQDANEILDSFPSTKEELFEYDCIVAFDPDWLQLDALQIDLIDTWVADEAGGLILISGPVHSSSWLESAEHSRLKALYPVIFRRGFTSLGDGRYGSKEPWPLGISKEGLQADFLRLSESPESGNEIWDDFDGVFGYFAVKGPKPGATVYATSGDPTAGNQDNKPAYMVGQFYGAGRVFFMGSGEMWRIRSLDVGYFEVFYTKLLRHMTQSRLLRGSRRGLLMVERDRYNLGDIVIIRAQMKDEQQRPLDTEGLDMQVSLPDGTIQSMRLDKIQDKVGNFSGQFRVYQEGTYTLSVLDAATGEQALTKRIQVRLPDLERLHPELNELLLSSISKQSKGLYYPTLLSAAEGQDNLRPVAQVIPTREEVSIIRGAPDKPFQKKTMSWLLGGICTALCLEWLLRRLLKLA